MIERRVITAQNLEIRQRGGKTTFTGYAAVFNSLSQPIGGAFREKISRGAFAKTIRNDDIRMLINHDPNKVLARSRAGVGTLKLSEDSHGLHVQAELPPTTYARDLAVVMQRGDMSAMSFGFTKVADLWDRSTSMPTRDLKEVRAYDVSPVTFPAYEETSASIRSQVPQIMAEAGLRAPADWQLEREQRRRRLDQLAAEMRR